MTALVVLREVLVHYHASPVHRAYSIAAEGMKRQVERLVNGGSLVEIDVLGSQHGLARHIVRIHLFPSARDGAAVEDALDAVAVGIIEDVLIQPHGLLLVARKEIDLDALHPDALHPGHILVAQYAV